MSSQTPNPTVNIPPIPADIQSCKAHYSTLPESLNAGEVERAWKSDLKESERVKKCLERLICQYADVRRRIAQVNDPVCLKESTTSPAKRR